MLSDIIHDVRSAANRKVTLSNPRRLEAETHVPDAEAVITEKGVCIEASHRDSPILRETGPGQVDGKHGLGPHYSTVLMQQVTEKAAQQGVAVGVARNLSHFGFGGFYTEMAAERGLIGIVMCNTGQTHPLTA